MLRRSDRRRFLICLAAVFSTTGALGAEARFAHLTAEQGLSSNWVHAILQDHRGFVWIGTSEGLNRYDGQRFKAYRHDARDPTTLPAGVAGVLFEDSKKRLWVGSGYANAGFALYDREQDRFTRFLLKPREERGNNVRAIAEDARGRLWLGTDVGVVSFDPDTRAKKPFPYDDETRAGSVLALHFDRSGRLWVGATNGLFRLDSTSGRYVRWVGSGAATRIGQNEVWDIHEDADGSLWVAVLGDGLHHIDPRTGQDLRYLPDPADPQTISHVRVKRLAAEGEDRLWVGTENGGLCRLDKKSGRFTRYLADPDDEMSLNSGSVWSLMRDARGILWVGTFDGGVNVLSPLAQRFGAIKAGRGALNDAHVSALLEDQSGNLWIGTDGGGVNRVDATTGRFTYHTHDPRNAATIGSNAVWALCEDRRGAIWVGGWDAGIGRLDPATGRVERFRHDPADPDSIASNHVWRILELRTGELLVTTQSGSDLFDPTTKRFTHLHTLVKGLGRGSVYAAAEDRNGNLWLGTTDGADFIDRASWTRKTFRYDANDPRTISEGWVQTVVVDSAGNAWLGTTHGLSCVRARDGAIRRYTTADGLPGESVTTLQEDRAGHLWIATSRGLTRLREALQVPESPELLDFGRGDGLQTLECARNASLRRRSGEMLFGGGRGLNTFFPDRIEKDDVPPRVVFTDLRLGSESVRPGPGSPLARSLTETRELTLSYEHSMLTLEFAALSYALPQKNQFLYRLEGFDGGWHQLGTQGSATFTGLPPGRYVLHVRASNSDGVWTEDGARLAIHITPPFWKAPWFLLLVGAGFVAAAYRGMRWRLSAAEIRRRELERVVEERTAEMQKALDGHRSAEVRLKEENDERRRAEMELRVSAEKLVDSNRELTEKQALLVTQQEALAHENEERRRAEEEAGRERDLLRALMDNIPDLIYFKDRERRFTRINRAYADALGLPSAQDAIGRTDVDFHSPELARAARADEERLLADGTPVLGKIEHETRRARFYLATKVPIRDASGRVNGLVGISKDVTERRAAEQRLETELAELLELVSQVALGDFTRRGKEGEETLGRIACSLNRMVDAFAAILGELRAAAFSLSSSASEILATSEQIARGALQSNDEVNATSSAVEEMAASMTQVSKHAALSAEMATRALEHVESGNVSVDASHRAMSQIDASVAETASKMRLLEQRSRQIFEVIELIEEIASQSNLLSLNAAIEAAHAGEAGRGFAVVAEEIRRLADRSTKAIRSVTEIVEGIIDETRAALAAMEDGTQRVKEGLSLSLEAQRSLREIQTSVRHSAELSRQISAASGEQSRATQTVAHSMQSIAIVTHDSSAGAMQTSKAVEGLVKLAEQLNAHLLRFKVAARS